MAIFLPGSIVQYQHVETTCPECGYCATKSNLSEDAKLALVATTEYVRAARELQLLRRTRDLFDRFPNSRRPCIVEKMHLKVESEPDPAFDAELERDSEMRLEFRRLGQGGSQEYALPLTGGKLPTKSSVPGSERSELGQRLMDSLGIVILVAVSAFLVWETRHGRRKLRLLVESFRLRQEQRADDPKPELFADPDFRRLCRALAAVAEEAMNPPGVQVDPEPWLRRRLFPAQRAQERRPERRAQRSDARQQAGQGHGA